MIFLLVVIGFATSSHDDNQPGGWHSSVHRVSNSRCNQIKSKIRNPRALFCGGNNLGCERQEGETLVGSDATYIGEFKTRPTENFKGPWMAYLDYSGLKNTDELPRHACDIYRMSAMVGSPWDGIENPDPNKISVSVGNPHKIVVGNLGVPEKEGTVDDGSDRTIFEITWETLTEIYIVVEGNVGRIEFSVEVDIGNFITHNMMGFHHTRKEQRTSIGDGTVVVAAEPFFFARSLTHGFIQSVTATCTNDIRGSDMLRDEVLRPNELGMYVASCRGGYRYPRITMRKFTSTKSAIAVCVSHNDPEGEGVRVYSGKLVSLKEAEHQCGEISFHIATLNQVQNDRFCDRIYPFGHFFYIWVRVTEPTGSRPEDVETVESLLPQAETFEDDVDQSSLIVDVDARTKRIGPGDANSNVFPQLMSSDQRWGVVAEYTYPKDCHVLKTNIHYKPLDDKSDAIDAVSRWIVTRRNGIWTYGEFMRSGVSSPLGQRPGGILSGLIQKPRGDGMSLSGVFRGTSVHNTFIDFAEPNLISGKTIARNFPQHPVSPPNGFDLRGDPRLGKYFACQRTFLAVKTVSECSFKLATNSWRYSLAVYGTGAIGAHIPWRASSVFPELQAYKDSVADVSDLQKVTLVPGRFYYTEYRIVDLTHQYQTNLDFKQVTLLWDCGEGLRVVPRLNLFSTGNTEEQIISDKVHIDVVRKAQFTVFLTSPPNMKGSTVVCTGPSSLVITPSVLTFRPEDWTETRTVTVFASVSYLATQNPDVFITCTSGDLRPLSISVTLGPNDPQHFQVSPSGYYANWVRTAPDAWSVRDLRLAPGDQAGCVYSLLSYSDGGFSFYIQTKHDSVVYGSEASPLFDIGPLVGVAFAYGPYVFAAYDSVGSDGWKVYRLSETWTPGGPKVSRASLDDPINPGKLTVEFPCRSVCQVIPHGDRFMQLSCVVAGAYTGTFATRTCLDPGQSFFQHPNGGTLQLLRAESVPRWPAGTDYNDEVFATGAPPSVMEGKKLVFPEDGEKMSVDEFAAFRDWNDQLFNHVDLGALGAWNQVQRKCSLMSDKIFNALRPFVSPRVSSWVTEINLQEFLRSVLKQCQTDYLMQKFLSCLGPYQFNEDDAVQSLRSIVYYFVTFSRLVSDNIEMVGRGLTMLADNGMPGHLCSRRGHLVGSPPLCACIGNVGSGNVYPNCPDTIDCPPATQWQLARMGAIAYPGVPGTDFCSAEKSIVIVRSLGVSINCFRGFCYYWSSPKVRNGLKYEMCITPYCVTGYAMVDGGIIWYGLTECGETVISRNNGETWSIPGNGLPTPATAEEMATNVGTQKVVVPLVAFSESYEVSTADIVRVGFSSGKMVTVTLKWWCECIDPDTWNILL